MTCWKAAWAIRGTDRIGHGRRGSLFFSLSHEIRLLSHTPPPPKRKETTTTLPTLGGLKDEGFSCDLADVVGSVPSL